MSARVRPQSRRRDHFRSCNLVEFVVKDNRKPEDDSNEIVDIEHDGDERGALTFQEQSTLLSAYHNMSLEETGFERSLRAERICVPERSRCVEHSHGPEHSRGIECSRGPQCSHGLACSRGPDVKVKEDPSTEVCFKPPGTGDGQQ